ncbi:MAG: hypothetical protein JNG83_01675 [Opitutaceae bacterium]|nr:hypothetical protein [Opitutaceae bacterium]
MPPTLKFFAGLWTLREYPSAGEEWPPARKFAEVKRRGFTAVGGRFVPEAPALCAELGLDYVLTIDADGDDYAAQLRQAVAWRPRRINVQLCHHDTPPAEAARVWLAMTRLAPELGLDIDLELHRDTATETPEKIREIARIFREAAGAPPRFCLDYSHFAVVKHVVPPFAGELLADADWIPPVRQVHLRPFNGHHAQVPATDGRGGLGPEFREYLEFVDALFAAMLRHAGPGDVFYACPEFGPRVRGGYGLACFPDVWEDAVRARDEYRERWRRLGGAA